MLASMVYSSVSAADDLFRVLLDLACSGVISLISITELLWERNLISAAFLKIFCCSAAIFVLWTILAASEIFMVG